MIIGADVKDTLTGRRTQVYAKQVINATGPFTDSLRQMSDPSKPSIIMPSAGLALPCLKQPLHYIQPVLWLPAQAAGALLSCDTCS